LCEVALGKIHCQEKAKNFVKPPKYHHSVMGIGEHEVERDGD
jgi:hypothetical protein